MTNYYYYLYYCYIISHYTDKLPCTGDEEVSGYLLLEHKILTVIRKE